MRHVLCCLPALALVLAVSPARGQDEPFKDHPVITRFPGYYMDSGKQSEFDSAEFIIGEDKTQTVEGRHWNYTYYLKEGAKRPSPLEIIRNYENQVRTHKGRVLFKDGAVIHFVMPLPKGERWVNVTVNNDGEVLLLTIVETAEMKQKLEFTAEQMAGELAASGKVTLRGILFDTGKTDIKPESDPLLEQVAAMLKNESDLKVRIEGHTDNVGAKAANLALSKGRAAAVKTALAAKGVAAARLTTEGFGDTKPVADNSTDEGRAQNRRVELVKQ